MNSRLKVRKPEFEAGAPPNFDGLAPFYHWMEALSFGPWLWWCRCAFLNEMMQARKALTFGDGDGRFTARLLVMNRTVRVDAIDASPAMLEALKRRTGQCSGRVRTEVADARSWNESDPASRPDQPYDLVYTHFFLDCLSRDEVRRLATRARSLISPTGIWVVSEFAIPESGMGRLVAQPLVSFLYWAFGVLTGLKVRCLPNYGLALRHAGFALRQRRTWLMGLLVSDVWSLAEPTHLKDS